MDDFVRIPRDTELRIIGVQSALQVISDLAQPQSIKDAPRRDQPRGPHVADARPRGSALPSATQNRSDRMNLTIDTFAIRQDAEGRYSLNDLYRASGSSNRHRPSLWLRSNQTRALAAELEREISEHEFVLRNQQGSDAICVRPQAPIFTESMGNPGTWCCKELVYAYAMWISPAFHIKVIRTFDAVMNDGFIKPSIQSENMWFARRPHWRQIRELALSGMRYRDIAAIVGRSAGSVGRCVRRMINEGLINPKTWLFARFNEVTAKRLVNDSQLCLNWGVPA